MKDHGLQISYLSSRVLLMPRPHLTREQRRRPVGVGVHGLDAVGEVTVYGGPGLAGFHPAGENRHEVGLLQLGPVGEPAEEIVHLLVAAEVGAVVGDAAREHPVVGPARYAAAPGIAHVPAGGGGVPRCSPEKCDKSRSVRSVRSIFVYFGKIRIDYGMRNSVGASPLPPLFAITIREEKPKIPNFIDYEERTSTR